MAGEKSEAVWPMPRFAFSVDLGDGVPAAFAEVSGLDSEPQAIEYRHGDTPALAAATMPGLRRVGNVTLKHGIVARGSALLSWFHAMELNTIVRRTVVIALLDEAGAAAMTWTLTNAFPTKMMGTALKADGDKVAIDTIDIAYEHLTVG